MMQGCDTLLMVGSGFPYSEFLPEEGQARGVQIDLDGACSASATRWRSTSPATPRTRCRRCCRCSSTRPTAMARRDRGRDERWRQHARRRAPMSRPTRSTRSGSSGSSPAAAGRGIVTADSGSAHQLVRPPPALPPRDAWRRCPARWPRWARRALRPRGQVRPPRPAGHRDRGRRRDADERDQRADHRRRSTGRAGATRAWSCWCSTTATSTRSPGSSACWPATQARGPQVIPDFPYARYAELLGLEGIRVDAPDRSAPPGSEALAADRPGACSRRSPTPTSRRCRRTSPSSRPSTSLTRSHMAIPRAVRSSGKP